MLRGRATAYPGRRAGEKGQNERKEMTVFGQADQTAEEQADLSDLVQTRRSKWPKNANYSLNHCFTNS